MKRRRDHPPSALQHAFDEVRFRADRTLNLRESLPSAADAAARAEAWLRQQQVQSAREVLIITGRGNQSPGGVSVVREAVLRLLFALRRRGVVSGHEEHTPGSFVVALAPVHALWETPRRKGQRTPAPPSPASLAALDEETRDLLRILAERALSELGAQDHERFAESEMLRQFAAVSATIATVGGSNRDRERQLRDAIRLALEQYD